MRINPGLSVVTATLAFLLAGCAAVPDCSAQNNKYSVDVDAADAAGLRACVDDECVTSADKYDGEMRVWIDERVDGGFRVNLTGAPPEQIAVTAIDSDGIALDARTFPLEWTPQVTSSGCNVGLANAAPISF